jgi:predicted dehydrogenase
VVGAGSLGFHHIRILRDLPGVELTGFVETRSDRAREVVNELGVKAHPSLDNLLDASDAVIVVVPTSAHFAVASAAIERGKHVFIEKPITTTLEEADALLELARKKGVIVQIGHIERFNQAVRAD